MFRQAFFATLMSMILAGAASAGISLPALLLLGSLTALAFLILVSRSKLEE